MRPSLKAAHTERAVVFGLPVKKKWSTAEPLKPSYYLDDNAPCQYHSLTDVLVLDALESLDTADGLRVAPLACGFDPTDRLAVEHLESVWARSDRWAGVGEVLLRHDDLIVELSWIFLDTVVPDPATITHRAEQITRLLQTLPRSVAQAVGTDTAGELWFS